jgi:hypothetical protein
VDNAKNVQEKRLVEESIGGCNVSRKQIVSLPSRMQREVRKVEAEAREANHGQDVGTGQTILRLKRSQPPLRTLLEARKIGPDELAAAEQIAQAASAVATGGILHAAGLERVDHGRQDERDWPHTLAIAVRNYQDWQRYWTAEWAHTRNPMLEVVWSAVVDEQPIAGIAADIGYGHRRTTRAVICGIRHYAAFTHMVTGIQRQAWLDAAQHVFDRRVPNTTS